MPYEGNRVDGPTLQSTVEAGSSWQEPQQAPPQPPEQTLPDAEKDPWAGIPEGQGWSYIYETEPEE